MLARDGGGGSEGKLAKNPTLPKAQLYNLSKDPAERDNLFETNPEKANELLGVLENDVKRGRSTDGPKSSNDTNKIVLWKSGDANVPAEPAED